jgi:SAM-dependent methyltransferase
MIDKAYVKEHAPGLVRMGKAGLRFLTRGPIYRGWKVATTPLRLAARSAAGGERRLEIGPGENRIEGFETLDIATNPYADYIHDAGRALPFADGTFSIIYASHILEHVPWYQVGDVLREWVRVLAPGGRLEIWVPDGLKIAKAFVEAETQGSRAFEEDGWFKFNEERDPCRWASGRIFTYGDGTGKTDHENWHRALFSPRYLLSLLGQAGLAECALLDRKHVRGYDHGWINLGAVGTKPRA